MADSKDTVTAPVMPASPTDIQQRTSEAAPDGAEAAKASCVACGRLAHAGCLHGDHQTALVSDFVTLLPAASPPTSFLFLLLLY